MRITVLKEIPEDAVLAREWNRLVERMEHPEVFFTYEWALAVSRSFHATLTPLLFLMHNGNGLCGVAALATRKEAAATASFLTARTADYCDIVSAPEIRREVLASLLREAMKLGVRRLALSDMPAESRTWRELPAAARAQHLHLTRRPAHEIALVEFGGDEQRATMISAVGRKKAIKQALKSLAKRGAVQIQHLVDPGESERCLPDIVTAQISRFLATGRISPLVRAERRIFLQELATLLSSQGWLRISRLEVNGEPVAWNYGFHFGDSWFWYLPSFKLDYEDCSPGSCLLRLAVEEGCGDQSIRELDLGLGDEPYKSRFATTTRATYDAELSYSLWRHALNTTWNFGRTKAARFPKAAARLRQAKALARLLQRQLRAEGLRGTIGHPLQRVVRLIASQEEILFFEAPAADRAETPNMRLEPATWENLAGAAIASSEDADTLQYLMRLATRLKEGKTSGLLLHAGEQAVHFLSVANADGFHIGAIGHTTTEFAVQDKMIFDCWTPVRFRGRGYYALAIRRAAAELQSNAQRVWTFCTAGDAVSIKGILKAGFTYSYSLVRQLTLGRTAIVRRERTYALPSEDSVVGKRPDLVVGTRIST
jgi:CelD/BcsL family acetyltransferase involved in cellulose biosynthesis/RimJ/RimL family protein N-acetyltransferase